MQELGYIPLDNRPIHVDQFQCCARISQQVLLKPSHAFLGTLTSSFNFSKTMKWLDALSAKPKHWIVSLDALMFGGLIQAREESTTFHTAFQRLKLFLERLRLVGAKAMAFVFLPRLGISVRGEDDLSIWKNVHKALSRGGISIFDAFGAWPKAFPEIPAEVLEKIYFVRKRNFHLIESAIEQFVPEPIECLLICQEDTSPESVQKKEVKALKEKIQVLKKEKAVFLHTGGDEAPYLLLGRFLKPRQEAFSISFFPPSSQDFVALYEALPQSLVLAEKLHFLKLKQNACSLRKVAIFSRKNQRDLMFEKPPKRTPQPQMAQCVIDNLSCNGGSLHLLAKYFKLPYADQLRMICGWNTFANKCGIALSAFKLLCSGEADPRFTRLFLQTRLLDDYFYQPIIRPQLHTICREKGWDFWNFGRHEKAILQVAEHLVEKSWKSFAAQVPFFQKSPIPSISFPFGRGFEAHLKL